MGRGGRGDNFLYTRVLGRIVWIAIDSGDGLFTVYATTLDCKLFEGRD